MLFIFALLLVEDVFGVVGAESMLMMKMMMTTTLRHRQSRIFSDSNFYYAVLLCCVVSGASVSARVGPSTSYKHEAGKTSSSRVEKLSICGEMDDHISRSATNVMCVWRSFVDEKL